MEKMKIQITEVVTNSKGETVFYCREQPFIPGKSYESTATTIDGAKWNISRIKETVILDKWHK
jgi:hypothetical protein